MRRQIGTLGNYFILFKKNKNKNKNAKNTQLWNVAGLDLLELAPLFTIHLVLYGLNCTSLVRPQYFHPEDEEDIIPSCTANHQSNAWWVTNCTEKSLSVQWACWIQGLQEKCCTFAAKGFNPESQSKRRMKLGDTSNPRDKDLGSKAIACPIKVKWYHLVGDLLWYQMAACLSQSDSCDRSPRPSLKLRPIKAMPLSCWLP